MKNLTFIFLLILFCLPTFAQAQEPVSVETFSLNIIIDSFKQLVASVNWLFVIVFMLITWLLNDTSEATNTNYLTWFSKIPKAVRALIIGVVSILVFAWVYNITAKTEIFKLLLSLIMAMAVYKFGIHKAFRFISKRLGLKFE